jgi:hypothetical protein
MIPVKPAWERRERKATFLSGPRKTEFVYVWSKRGWWTVIMCILKELDLPYSGCVLVVNCRGNGNKMSDSIKYAKCLTKEGNVNFIMKRPLPQVGYFNLLCPSACIRIIIKYCNLFEVCKEKFWRRKCLFIISFIPNIQILIILNSNKLTFFKKRYQFKWFRSKSLGLCLSLRTIYLEILLLIFNE